MKPTSRSFGLLALLPLFSQGSQEPRNQSPLQRIPPQEEGAGRDLSQLFARDFDADRWRELLATSDLDQREQNLEVLLKRAGLDPAARGFLEELARDPHGGELSWTARLALRELGRARFPVQSPFALDPFGHGGRLEDMLRQWMDQGDWGLFQMQPFGQGQRAGGGGNAGQGRTVHIEQTAQGARIEIVEERDGEEHVRTYDGASLDEILAENPELEDELGDLAVRVQPGAPLGLDLQLGPRPGGRGVLPAPFGNDVRKLPALPQQSARPVRTDKLGVIARTLTPEHRKELGLEEGQGLYVERSATGTFAHLLGIGSGDVLLEIDGQPVGTEEDIGRIMAQRAADAPLTVTWLDDLGQRRTKTWPANVESGAKVPAANEPAPR